MDSMFRRSFFGISLAGLMPAIGRSQQVEKREPYCWCVIVRNTNGTVHDRTFHVDSELSYGEDKSAEEYARWYASLMTKPGTVCEVIPLYR